MSNVQVPLPLSTSPLVSGPTSCPNWNFPHVKFGWLLPRRQSGAALANHHLPSHCTQSLCMTTPLAVRPALLRLFYKYGIFNVRTNLGACHAHEGGSATKTSAQELTRRDRKHAPSPPCPAKGSNPGCSDLNSVALTTELRPPVR